MGKKAKVNDSKYRSLKMSVTDKERWRSQQNIKGHCVTDKHEFLNTSGTKKISTPGIHVNGGDMNNDETRQKAMTRYLPLRPNMEEVAIPCVQCYRRRRKLISHIREDVS